MNGTRTAPHSPALIARFNAKHRPNESGCWVWTAATNGRGYGVIGVNGRQTYAHRLSYEIHVGPIPEGLAIDHLCRNRGCVNADHLEAVTTAENNRRMAAVKSHCPRGHEYTPANTYVRGVTRFCRECNRLSKHRLKPKDATDA